MRRTNWYSQSLLARVIVGASMSLLADGIAAAQEEPTETTDSQTAATCVTAEDIYLDARCLKEGIVRPYKPQYELWSDNADKERFIYLPPNLPIDASNIDRWSFPENTRLYKTFKRLVGGVEKRIETRIISKNSAAPGFKSWSLKAYKWNDEQTVATEVPSTGEFVDVDGFPHYLPSGTCSTCDGFRHWIPSSSECTQCHRRADDLDPIVGFDAIQLAHDGEGVTLAALIDEGRLSHLKDGFKADAAKLFPEDTTAREAIGYLHGNCGNCHGGLVEHFSGLTLWAKVGMTAASNDPESGFCQLVQALRLPAVTPRDPSQSAIIKRMQARALEQKAGAKTPAYLFPQMPPAGTVLQHDEGLVTVGNWIGSLDESFCTSSMP